MKTHIKPTINVFMLLQLFYGWYFVDIFKIEQHIESDPFGMVLE